MTGPALDDQAVEAAATLLRRTVAAGAVIEALPPALRPASRAEGYRIQARLGTGPLHGWKIAATSAAGQAHIGVEGPLAGRIPAARVVADGATVPFHPNRMAVAEVEFGFRMARDLPPRDGPYTVPEVMAAVASLHPALEIPDSRFTDFARVGAAQLIADNACGHWFVEGPAAPDWRDVDLAGHRVRALRDGMPAGEGLGAAVLGDPCLALTWLVNELRGLGLTLGAGMIVSTGTCMPPIPVQPGSQVMADFGALGCVSVRFA